MCGEYCKIGYWASKMTLHLLFDQQNTTSLPYSLVPKVTNLPNLTLGGHSISGSVLPLAICRLVFFLLIKKGKNVHVRPHISKLSFSFSFFAHATSSLFSFLTRRPFIPSCYNDLLPSSEYQLPLPDPTSAVSSPCGRAGQAT